MVPESCPRADSRGVFLFCLDLRHFLLAPDAHSAFDFPLGEDSLLFCRDSEFVVVLFEYFEIFIEEHVIVVLLLVGLFLRFEVLSCRDFLELGVQVQLIRPHFQFVFGARVVLSGGIGTLVGDLQVLLDLRPLSRGPFETFFADSKFLDFREVVLIMDSSSF